MKTNKHPNNFFINAYGYRYYIFKYCYTGICDINLVVTHLS